jgi:hypothetical protein
VLILREKEILARVKALGFDIPPSRFAKWREKGLVPTTPRPGLGQGKGRAACGYPEVAVEQTAAIASLLAQGLDFEEMGWRLWVAGYDVAAHYWFEVFAAIAKEFDDCASVFREALDSDALEANPIEDIADKLYEAETSNQLLRQVRKSLGRERFRTMFFHVAQMATGRFTSVTAEQDRKSKQRSEELRIVDVGLGLLHARSDTVNGVGPIFSGDYSSILQAVFEPLFGISLLEFLNAADPQRLRQVARSFTGFMQSIAAASLELNRVFEKDAFGFNRVAMLAGLDRKTLAGLALIWTLVLQRSREPLHDLKAMGQLFTAAAKDLKKYPNADSDTPATELPEFQRNNPRKPVK